MGLRENLEELRELRKRAMDLASGSGFGSRLRKLRKAKGWTLEDLSQATGIAKSYISQVETGYVRPPRDDKIRQLARALNVNMEQMKQWAQVSRMPEEIRKQVQGLASAFDSAEAVICRLLARVADAEKRLDEKRSVEKTGEAAPAAADEGAKKEIDIEALEKSGLLAQIGQWGDFAKEAVGIRRIPVINKVAAGYPQEFTDLDYPAGVADEYVGASAELADPNAFAVRVVGDSMEPKYRQGDIVIISPAEEVKNGDDCFVRFTGSRDGESTFKRVYFDAPDHIRLQPLNGAYAPTVLRADQVERMYKAVARYERL